MIDFEEFHADLERMRKTAVDATIVIEPMTTESKARIDAFRAANDKIFRRGEKDRRRADRRIWSIQRKIERTDAAKIEFQEGATPTQ